MNTLIKGFSLALIIFGVILLVIFTAFDLGFFGPGVEIKGFYYIFMTALLGIGLWLYRNRHRFDKF
ncbi:hypothetical protein SAMN06298216_3155 [Spirosomataceae bacterium TFI 002]|nr:hypothetical protein SAMN06298216_3155 [Spirosomataceae bacterium TFI 002]